MASQPIGRIRSEANEEYQVYWDFHARRVHVKRTTGTMPDFVKKRAGEATTTQEALRVASTFVDNIELNR